MRAAPPVRLSRIPVNLIIAEAAFMPLVDRSFDTAVSTVTRCSVFDPVRVLNELHRVRFQKVVACGCHLNRPVADLIEKGGGFRFDAVRTFYARKAPGTLGCVTTGAALKA